MKIKAAKTRQHGMSIAMALVDRPTIENREKAMSIIRGLQPKFPDMHIVLVHDAPGEAPVYFGRPDIAQKLSGLAMNSIVWEEYDIE